MRDMERQIDGKMEVLRDMERHGGLKRQDQWKDVLRNGEFNNNMNLNSYYYKYCKAIILRI
jgi:hypothetical protein